MEITVWAVNATTPPQAVERLKEHSATVNVAGSNAGSKTVTGSSKETRHLHNASTGEMVAAAVVERAELKNGDRVSGPAVITEDETTIIMPMHYHGVCQSDGCIDLSRESQSV